MMGLKRDLKLDLTASRPYAIYGLLLQLYDAPNENVVSPFSLRHEVFVGVFKVGVKNPCTSRRQIPDPFPVIVIRF
jgi:hypothetical protein